jgi:hypothetical protein
MTTPSFLWHYTYGQNLQKIVADKSIKPSSKYVGKDAPPIVWFSRNPVWDSAATKGLITDEGTVQNLTMEELRQHGGGLYRIKVAKETAPHNWDDFVKKSGLAHDIIAELRRLAKDKGASLKEWFASFEPVNQEKWLAIEVMDNHKWISAIQGPQTNFVVHGS